MTVPHRTNPAQPPAPRPTSEEIWLSFRDFVRSTIARQVHNAEDVEDLVQEIFARIHARLETLRSSENLTAWLGSLTRHALIDYYRRKASAPQEVSIETDSAASGETLTLSTENHGAPAFDFDEVRQSQRLFECISPMIDLLPEPYLEAFVLVERDQLSHQDAADKLGITRSALKSRVQRARKKLREILDRCCDLEFDTRGKILDCHSRNC